MKKTKLIKRASTTPNSNEGNHSNPHVYQKNNNVQDENNFINLIKNLCIASTEFYKISSGNNRQMLKLLSALENENNNNQNNYYNGNYDNNNGANNILNDLKMIVTINNSNLYNFIYDSKIILQKIEIDRRNQRQHSIKSISNQKRPSINVNNNNKTIDVEHNRYKNINYSPINSNITTKRDNNNTFNNNEIAPVKSLFTNLFKFKDIIGQHSPKMKNIFMKINNDLYNEFIKLVKEKQKNKINLGIQSTRIEHKKDDMKSFRGNSFSKTAKSFYEQSEDKKGDRILLEKINIFKIKNDNYKLKIDELQCQLEDLKTYSNALEKTLEENNINKNDNMNNNG
jgi:hypothetical protein